MVRQHSSLRLQQKNSGGAIQFSLILAIGIVLKGYFHSQCLSSERIQGNTIDKE